MKIVAILLMLLGVFVIVVYGFTYLLGFAMSFDAPGSTTDPQAWLMRLLIFLPIVVFIVVLIFAFLTYYKGNYMRSTLIGSVIPISGLIFYLFLTVSTSDSLISYQETMAQDAEDARLYPIRKYIRKGETGADTIIVFPNRIVAYRFYQGPVLPFYGGPLGDLNESRDTMVYNRSHDTKIKIEELYHFMDENGQLFTNEYYIQ